jgi:hemoglobin-like flavoprotein
MTPNQIDLVQSSFAKVVPISDAAASLFYGRLFEIAPEVRPLFRNDMTQQGYKLLATLGFAVNGLRNLDVILPAVQALAAKHVDYGVKAAHYAPVGEALIWTLEQGLGDDFTGNTPSLAGRLWPAVGCHDRASLWQDRRLKPNQNKWRKGLSSSAMAWPRAGLSKTLRDRSRPLQRQHFQGRTARQLRAHHAVAGAVGRKVVRGHHHPRPRNRIELAGERTYLKCREAVLK